MFIIRLYLKIFEMVPFNTIGDLKKSYFEEFPKKIDSDFFEELNNNENTDMELFTDILEEFSIEFLKKMISIGEFLKIPKSNKRKSKNGVTLIKNNCFLSLFNNASQSLFNQFLEIITKNIVECANFNSINFYCTILQAISVSNPEITLKTLIPILSSKIIKKIDQKNNKKNKDFPNFFQEVIEKQENFLKIVNIYELEIINENFLCYYLDLLESITMFSGKYLCDYEDIFQSIIYNCLISKEKKIFEKGAELLNILITSLVNIYPKDFKIFNPDNYKENCFNVFYYKKIGNGCKEKFEIN